MTPLSRRRFLGGAGTLVALPFLEAFAPRKRALASGPEAPPVRLLVYFVPNGIHMPAWTPATAGKDWETTPILAPVEPFREDLLLLTGLVNPVVLADDAPHTHAGGSMLSDVPIVKHAGGQVTGGVSFDQVAAQALAGATRYPSLEVGADEGTAGFCEEGYSCAYLQSIAWAGPKLPLPPIHDPKLLFDHLFAGWDPAATAQEVAWRKAEKKSVLDLVLAQAKGLGASLGTADRLRMEQYQDGVAALEKALLALPPDAGPMCVDPEAPPTAYGLEQRVSVLTDLMVLALQCDQTRVVTFMLENEFGSRYYDFLGVGGDHHGLTHHFGNEEKIADVVTIDTWEVSRLALLLERLKAVPEGDGTLLDHTAVLFTASMSNGNTHSVADLPVLLAGRAGGAIDPGRHVRYDDAPSRANLYVSLLHALGVPVETFGQTGTSPLPGLKAT